MQQNINKKWLEIFGRHDIWQNGIKHNDSWQKQLCLELIFISSRSVTTSVVIMSTVGLSVVAPFLQIFHRRLKSAGKEPVAAPLPRLPCSAGPLLFIDWLAAGWTGRLSRAGGVGGQGVGGVGGQGVGGSGRKLFAFGGDLVVQWVESLGFGAVKVEPPVADEVVLASML
jgi:hypothetical protein